MEMRQQFTPKMALEEVLSLLLEQVLRRDYEPLALGLALFRIGLGILLLVAGHTFSSAPAYGPLACLLGCWQAFVSGEGLLASLLLLSGLAHLGGIALRKHRVRNVGSLSGTGLFATIGCLLWVGNPIGFGGYTYAGLALFALWTYLRFYVDWSEGRL